MASVVPSRSTVENQSTVSVNTNVSTSANSGRSSFSEQISALGARISRAISRDGSQVTDGSSRPSTETSASTYVGGAVSASTADGLGFGLGKLRSLSFLGLPPDANTATLASDTASHPRSRGREVFSTGRGGAGNIRSPTSIGLQPAEENVGSPARGREPLSQADRVTHVGRGGAGNVRSPSKEPHDPSAEIATQQYEQQLIENYDENVHTVSTGRGGAGNIRRSPDNFRSRELSLVESSQTSGRGLHSTGRGGAGNITGLGANFSKEDLLRLEHSSVNASPETLPDGSPAPPPYHSTGRGGLANVTSSRVPPPEGVPTQLVHPGEFVSSGRGGAGNIRNRSRNRVGKRVV